MAVKPLFVLALLAFAAGSAVADTGALDFSQARALAHDRVDAIKIEMAETAKRESQAKNARSLHGPKIELDAKQIWGRKTVDFGSVNVGALAGSLFKPGAITPDSNIGQLLGSMSPIDLYFEEDIGGPRAAINAELPIYMGGAINAKVRAADEAVYESQAKTQAKRDTIDTELAQKYFAVQLARSVERLQEEMLAQQELEVKKALRFEKTGTISKLERMAVEVNRDSAKRELLNAQTNRHVAESELAGLLREESVGELTNPLFVVTDDIGTLKSWQDKALGTSPVLKGVQAMRRQAEQGVTAAKAAWHPQVYAFANYNLIKHYLTIPEPDWIAGIGVNVNQTLFRSSAPNPVSMAQVSGAPLDRRRLLDELVDTIAAAIAGYTPGDDEAVTERYREILYRGSGFYPYFDVLAQEPVYAEVVKVEPSGRLTLRTDAGEERSYLFKEIQYII